MRPSLVSLLPRAPAITLAGVKKRIAVVGAGPAGFYATQKLLGLPESHNIKVDLFEELPTPFGLVRYGVAPDHPEVRNCQHKFEQTASDPRLRFIGNCKIGLQESSTPLTPSISLEQLQKHYDAILLTYGASRDRTLNIPGEATLKNILSARSFVHFYNGYPVSQDVQWPDLSKVSNVTIVGQGNVALDCARMLLSPVDDLAKTDAPDSALAELARSQVKHVSLVGRRGALQFAGTTKELREMMQLPGVKFQANAHELYEAEQTLSQYGSAIKNARMKKRLLGLMQEGSETQLGDRDWSLQFFKSPTAFLGEESVRAVEWERNELVKDPDQDPSSWRVKGTNQTTKTPADLVLTSIGYRSVPVPGVPFDGMAGVVKNVNGRVVSEAGSAVDGLYTCGWLARGPTGVLTSTMMDAFVTAETVASDLSQQQSDERPELDLAVLRQQHRLVHWQDWQLIDQEERRRGAERGKEREKMTSLEDMLAILP